MSRPEVEREPFGSLPDGRAVSLFRLRAAEGLEAAVLDLGGILQALHLPDRSGSSVDVALGFDRLEPYLGAGRYFGALVGRYANRIAGARFQLDGEIHRLPANDGANCLHGGTPGFNGRLWTAEPFTSATAAGLDLHYRSPDGEMGFPGTLDVTLRYALEREGRLVLDYSAVCDRPTVLNLTSHAYFNLAGAGAESVLDHELSIDAIRVVAVDDGMIPTGELLPVAGTPLDFTQPRRIGSRIEEPHPQLRHAEPRHGGYDFTYVLERPGGTARPAARLREPASGRTLDLFTSEPGLQLYTANRFTGLEGKERRPYRRWSAVALEAQHFPDSPNRPAFPSTVLRPGETYRQTTTYRFGSG